MTLQKFRRLFLFLVILQPLIASAGPDTLVDLATVPGSVGLGAMLRSERSPYKGAGISNDLVPLYIYEGAHVYLHGTRVGLKLSDEARFNVDLFLNYRFEGFPNDKTPASLAGMSVRRPSTDLGLGYHYRSDWGSLSGEVLHDADNLNNGTELRLAYKIDWQSGNLSLRPGVTLSWRNSNLNDYYFGVRPNEATALRPAYIAGAGTDLWLGVYASYELSNRWRLFGGVGVNRLDIKVRNSPIVNDAIQPMAMVGAAYDFGDRKPYAEARNPLRVKVLTGRSTDCNLLPVMTLRCGSTHTADDTRIAAVELGRTLVERVNDWPLDFVGYLGILHHDENHLQPDSWQLDAYIKAYYDGFPWSERVRTRVGVGAGFSMAERVPYVEQRDQNLRGRSASKLLNYLDPSIDFSVGDLLGSRAMKETYFGVGASHRSGIFGSSQMLGNVNGGSNYLYTYIETKL